MGGLLTFIREFLGRGGHHILSSSLVAKVLGFVASVAVVRLVSPEEYGRYTYVVTVLFVVSPFIAGGLNHALLRYGALGLSRGQRRDLFEYAEARGMRYTLGVVVLLCLAAPLITWESPGSLVLLLIGALSLLTKGQLATLQSYLRVLNLNRGYARVTNWLGVSTLVFSVALTLAFGVVGLTASLVVVPLAVTALLYRRDWPQLWRWVRRRAAPPSLDARGFLRYGLHVGLGAIASQLTLKTDILVVANLLEGDTPQALYGVGSLIPFNLMFVPALVMVTDFVTLASRSGDRAYLRGYLRGYWKVFGLFSAAVLVPLWLAAPYVLWLFGPEYAASEAVDVMRYLTLGLVGSFMLRVPSGNILAAVGKASWVSVGSYVTLAANLAASILLTRTYGIAGAAMATCGVLWFSGLLNSAMLTYWMRRALPSSPTP